MKLQPLEFEKPIIELEEKLADLKRHSRANDINFDSEVQRMEGEVITLQKLFEFKIDHFDAERRIVGRLHPTGLRPGFLGKFERHGIELPLSTFGDTASAIYGANAAGLPEWVKAGDDR